MNTFESLRQVLNGSIETGFITRSELLKRVIMTSTLASTMDCYRLWFTHAGYLEVLRPGVYKLVKTIPFGLTGTQLRKQAYPEYYKSKS